MTIYKNAVEQATSTNRVSTSSDEPLDTSDEIENANLVEMRSLHLQDNSIHVDHISGSV